MDNLEQEELRKTPRSRAILAGKIIINEQSSFDCLIRSKSDAGFGLKMGCTIGVPDKFKLFEEKTGLIHNCEVVWRKKNFIGCIIVTE